MKTYPRWVRGGITITTFFALIGCSTVDPTPALKAQAWVQLLTRAELEQQASDEKNFPGLGNKLDEVWPDWKKEPVGAHGLITIGLLAKAAGAVTEAGIKWIGGEIGKEMATHSAQISASGEVADWGVGTRSYIAVELRRDDFVKDVPGKNALVVIVLLRPAGPKGIYQMLPVFWCERSAAAKQWGDTLSSTVTVALSGSWIGQDSGANNASYVSWTWQVPKYKVGDVRFTEKSASPGPKVQDPDIPEFVEFPAIGDDSEKVSVQVSGPVPSDYFALSMRTGSLKATVSVAEADNSWLVQHLTDLGTWLSGEASAAGTAVTNKINPPPATTTSP
jgi:hypothetical protein